MSTACDLCTTEETEKERENVGTMRTNPIGGGALVDSFRSDGLARTRLWKASGWLGVHLLLPAQLPQRSKEGRGQGQDASCKSQYWEICTSETFHLSSRAHVGFAYTCHGYMPKSGIEEHAIYTNHAPTYP